MSVIDNLLGVLERRGVPAPINDQICDLVRDWEASLPKKAEANQIEINRRTGPKPYEMCDILYWADGKSYPDYIIVRAPDGQELICRQAMGAWCEMTSMEIIMNLRMGLARRA